MASDYLLEIEGIKGESKDKKHPGTIEVHSFSWGCSNAGSMASGSGGGAGKASFSDLSFMSSTASQSPLLMLACATGQHIKKAVLTVRKAGGPDALDYFMITIEKARLTHHQVSGGAGADSSVLSEEFAFSFQKVKVEYVPQGKTGGGRGTLTFETEINTNA